MGGKSAQKQFTGPVLLQPASAIDAFVKIAAAGTEFVYCEAPLPMHGETWDRARELAQLGVVRTHQRRRAGGGYQWFVVRTSRSLPKQVSPQEKVLADRATSAIFTELKRAARLGMPCPTDSDLARRAGLNTRDQATWRIRQLIRFELIQSTLVYEGGVPARVVTITDTRHAGGAGGKFTALPKKWAALRRAAERDLRTAVGQQ